MVSSTSHTTSTYLTGFKARLLQGIWLGFLVLSVVQSVRSFLIFLGGWNSGSLKEVIIAQGINPSVFFPMDVSLSIFHILLWLGAGIFLVWKRPTDWQALNLTILIFSVGANLTTFGFFLPGTDIGYHLIDIISYPTFLIMFGTFPTGEFKPKGLVPLYVAFVIYAIVYGVMAMLSVPVSETYALVSLIIHDAVIQLAGFGAQYYRWRNASDAVRQQNRLALLGFMMAIIGNILFAFVIFTSGPVVYLITRPLGTLAFALTLIFFFTALMKNRIWDIEFFINRSLVYVGLTIGLGTIFLGGFLGMRWLMGSVLGIQQDIVAIALPAMLATALFTPARKWFGRFVDRRFYGINLDYQQAIRDYREQEKEILRTADTKTSFGGYTGLELIGRGGMGEVYRALDETSRVVAIKILPGEHGSEDEALKRFSREAQAISSLDHPNIVKLYSAGAKDGAPFMVMEYIDGVDLGNMLTEGGVIPLEQALPILHGLASALDYAHEQGVIHRDIKPSNIMVERDSSRPVLMDFGIARLSTAVTRLTRTGGLVGTLDYVSPEQIQESQDVDHRADIYSLGVLTYQMLTGKLPFEKSNPGALVLAHLVEPAPDARKTVPTLPRDVASAILQAMSKKPDGRFDTAGEMIQMMAG